MHLVGAHAEQVAHELISLADELHIAVFDAVVNHFDKVTRAVLADPIAAGSAVLDLGADRLEYGLHARPCGGRAAGHHARTLESALLAAGNTRADIEQTLALDISGASCGIGEVGVAAVDDYIALVEQRNEAVYHGVDRRARLYHHHDLAGLLERSNKLLKRISADYILSLGSAVDEIRNLLSSSVENGDGEALALHIHNEVLAHYGKADKTYI